MGYLANFMVYTFAMIGVIVLALMVFKASTSNNHKGSTKFLKIHDTLSLGPRKTLYIVSAGEEKFLIAGDVDKTCLISKLETDKRTINTTIENITETIPKKTSYMDRNSLGIHTIQNKPYTSVMKNLAEVLRSK